MQNSSRLLRWSERAYRLLLRAYPEAHRRDYGAAMAETFRDLCRAALRERGAWALLVVWLAVLTDMASSAVQERGGCMATLKQFFTSKLTTDRADRKFGQIVYFAACPTVFVLAIYKLGQLQLTEAQLFLGLLAAVTLSFLFLIVGLLIGPAKEPLASTA